MPQGTIKKVIADKGFGFISGEGGELFFHHSSLEGTAIEALRIGQAVTYDEGRGPKGPRAENVKPV
jgi:cold shock protein